MGELESFQDTLKLLPSWTCQEIEAFDDTKSATEEKYWETDPWFINAVYGSQLLGCSAEDTFVDLTSGQGLVVLQFAHFGFLQQCIGIESVLGRHTLAMSLHDKFKTVMKSKEQAYSNVELLHGQCQSKLFSARLKEGILFSAGNRYSNLKHLLMDSEPGTRIMSDYPLSSFKLDSAINRYQIIEVTQDHSKTSNVAYVLSTAQQRPPVPHSLTNPEKVAKYVTRADPIPELDLARRQYDEIDRDDLETTLATSSHITAAMPLQFPGLEGAPTIPQVVYDELGKPVPSPVTTRGGHATIPPLEKPYTFKEKPDEHKKRIAAEPKIKMHRLQFPNPQEEPVFKSDNRIAKDKELSVKKVKLANTNKQVTFVDFYIHTVRNWDRIQTHKSIQVFAADKTAFVPIQVRHTWKTYKCKLLQASENEERWLIQLVTPEISMCYLKYELWVRVSELFLLEKECVDAVRNRNLSVAGHLEQQTAVQLQNEFKVSADQTKFILEKMLPATSVRVLGLTTENVTLIPDTGIQTDELKFNVVTERNWHEYLETSNPSWNVPVIFRDEAASRVGQVLPDENPSEMPFTLKGSKKQRVPVWRRLKSGPGWTDVSQREPEAVFHVCSTNEARYSCLQSSETLSKMLSYMAKPMNERGNPRSMPVIPIINNAEGHKLQPPKMLANDDLLEGIQKYPGNFTPLSRYAGIHGQNSILRFRCDMDGAIVWTAVGAGVQIVFFWMNPTSEDYDYLATCADPNYRKTFLKAQMSGRILFTPLWPGECIIYPGSIPHAVISPRDALTYGGRFITALNMPRLFEFGHNEMKSKCKGDGYEYLHVAHILHGSAVKIFEKLWRTKCANPDVHQTTGLQASAALEGILVNSAKKMNITLVKFAVIRNWLKMLRVMQGTSFEQSVGGFYYGDATTKQRMDALFKSGAYTPVLSSSREGTLIGPLESLTAQDMQYSTQEWRGRQNHAILPNDFYESLYCRTPRFVALQVADRFGFFAIRKMERSRPIAVMTGVLRTYDEMVQKYAGATFGRAYIVKEIEVEGRGLTSLWTDSNLHGGFSIFVRQSHVPNTVFLPATIKDQAVILVVAKRDIEKDEEILIPLPPTPAPSNAESIPQVLRRLSDPAADIDQTEEESEGSTEPLHIDLDAPTIVSSEEISPASSSEELVGVEDLLVEPNDTTASTTTAVPESEENAALTSHPTDLLHTVAHEETESQSEKLPKNKKTPAAVPQLKKTPSAAKESTTKRKAKKTPSPVQTSPEDDVPVLRRSSRKAAQPKRLKVAEQAQESFPPEMSGTSSAGPESPIPGPSSAIPGLSTRPESPIPGPSSAIPGPSTRPASPIPGPTSSNPGPSSPRPGPSSARRGTASAQAGPSRRSVASATSGEEESGDQEIETRGTFRMGNQVIRKAWIRTMPHDLNREVFDRLPAAAQQSLREIAVGRFYVEQAHFEEINMNLARLYGKEGLFCCCVCSHLGIPTDHFTDETFHQYATKYRLRHHYRRYHQTPFECPICGEEFNTAKKLRAHLESQIKNPTGHAHRKKEKKSLKSLRRKEKDKKKGN